MNPATPVTTQTLGEEASCSRRWRYGAMITSSQARVPAGLIQSNCAREHDRPIIRAADRGYPRRRVKASSIPRMLRRAKRAKSYSCRSLAMARSTRSGGYFALCRGIAPVLLWRTYRIEPVHSACDTRFRSWNSGRR
jgi:hypothetical protein